MFSWPKLESFSMLLVNNNRSKAYIQNLVEQGIKPSFVVLLDTSGACLPEHTENDNEIYINANQKFIRKCPVTELSFDEKEHVLKTLEDNNIKHSTVSSLDVNSKQVIEEISKLADDYIIYSGPGGTILRKDILSLGKVFIHAHPGWLPDYRGSTVLYYSMLLANEIGCSVIAFTEEVDKGPIFLRKKFKAPSNRRDLDYVVDPLIRASLLLEFLSQYKDRSPKEIEYRLPEKCKQDQFYIIHPVLKHLAILGPKESK